MQAIEVNSWRDPDRNEDRVNPRGPAPIPERRRSNRRRVSLTSLSYWQVERCSRANYILLQLHGTLKLR